MRILTALSIALGSTLLICAAEPAIPNCIVLRPQGEYQLLRFSVHIPGNPEANDKDVRNERVWSWVGGGRDGEFPVENGVGVTEPGGVLMVRDGRLTGSVVRVSGSRRGGGFLFSHPRQLENELVFDATVRGGVVTGLCRVNGIECKVDGRLLTERQLRETNEIPLMKSWPWLQGPPAGGLAAEPTPVELTQTLNGIRQAWRIEEIDIGAGMGSISRFMHQWPDATTLRTSTGSTSPLVADGKVFYSYYVPAPREPNQPVLNNPWMRGDEATLLEAMLAEARKEGFEGDAVPSYAAEKLWQNVDDIVLCADASNGKTLWKAVVRKRPTEGVHLPPAKAVSPNFQHHKLGPFNRSPAYADGRIFALSMSNTLMAFDATNGEPLWERPVRAGLAEALLAVDDVVMAPNGGQWSAFGVESGELLWTAGKVTACTLVPWSHGDKTYLIGRMRVRDDRNPETGIVACLDAATGEQVWEIEANVVSSGRGGGGAGGMSIFGDTLLVNRDEGKKPPKGKGSSYAPALAAYRLSPGGAEEIWKVGGVERSTDYGSVLNPIHYNSAPVVVRGKYVFTPNLKTIDLQTGRIVGSADEDTPVENPDARFVPSRLAVPRNGGHMMSLGSLVLVRIDGTHGEIRSGWYHIGEDGSIRLLNQMDPEQRAIEWRPPGAGTTSYHNPLYYPMIDGRVFIRQEDGIYSYDLRMK